MWEEILKAIPVYLFSTFKFILGPILGFAAGLKLITSILATVLGTMTSVVAFTFFGDWLKSRFSIVMKYTGTLLTFRRTKKEPKLAKQPNPKWAAIWKKYGIVGIAFFTPILLTPIGGTLLAVSLGAPKDKIIFYMFVSASAWAIMLTSVIYFFGKEVLPDVIK